MDNRAYSKPLIHTNQRFLSLKEFALPTRVVSEAGVTATFTQSRPVEISEVCTIYTNDGYALRTSGATEILTIRDGELKFRTVKHLKQNDLCLYSTDFFNVEEESSNYTHVDTDYAYTLGVLSQAQIIDVVETDETAAFAFPMSMGAKVLSIMYSMLKYRPNCDPRITETTEHYILSFRNVATVKWLKRYQIICGSKFRQLETPMLFRRINSSLFASYLDGMRDYARTTDKSPKSPYTFPSRRAAQQMGSLLRAFGHRNQLRHSYSLKIPKGDEVKNVRFVGVNIKPSRKMLTRTKKYMHNAFSALENAGYNPLSTKLHWDSIRYVYRNRSGADGFQLTVSNNIRVDGFILNTGAEICT